MARFELRTPEIAGGDTDARATVVQWLVALGGCVEEGEPVLEVETDKAIVAIESPVSGVLTETLVSPGDEVAAGQVVGVVETGGDEGAG